MSHPAVALGASMLAVLQGATLPSPCTLRRSWFNAIERPPAKALETPWATVRVRNHVGQPLTRIAKQRTFVADVVFLARAADDAEVAAGLDLAYAIEEALTERAALVLGACKLQSWDGGDLFDPELLEQEGILELMTEFRYGLQT